MSQPVPANQNLFKQDIGMQFHSNPVPKSGSLLVSSPRNSSANLLPVPAHANHSLPSQPFLQSNFTSLGSLPDQLSPRRLPNIGKDKSGSPKTNVAASPLNIVSSPASLPIRVDSEAAGVSDVRVDQPVSIA